MNRPTSSRPHSASGGRGNIELNIDELVIRGVSPRDRQRIVRGGGRETDTVDEDEEESRHARYNLTSR